MIHYHNNNPQLYVMYNPVYLSLNHYAIMSKEYFTTVKMTRGDAGGESHDNFRDMNYFHNYDYKEVIDTELKYLVEKMNKQN